MNKRLVPGAGIEPARYFYRGILSPLRLPISPPGLSFYAVCSDPFGIIRDHKESYGIKGGEKSGDNVPMIPAPLNGAHNT